MPPITIVHLDKKKTVLRGLLETKWKKGCKKILLNNNTKRGRPNATPKGGDVGDGAQKKTRTRRPKKCNREVILWEEKRIQRKGPEGMEMPENSRRDLKRV